MVNQEHSSQFDSQPKLPLQEGLEPERAYTDLVSFITEANQLAESKFGTVAGITKADDPNQILTEIDLAVGQQTIRMIRDKYPKHWIVDEEAGVIEGTSKFVWTIDPVDGTAFLASGDLKWGTMIGLMYDGKPIGGAFSLPVINGGITCVSMEGVGVTLIDNQGKASKISHLSQLRSLSDGIVDFGIDKYFKSQDGINKPDQEKNDKMAILEARIRETTRKLEAGGSPYGWIQMMKGNYAGSLCYKASKIWDRVPVHHAITSLGGVVTEFDGTPFDYTSAIATPNQVKFGVCAASNPTIHQQLQELIHQNAHLWQNI